MNVALTCAGADPLWRRWDDVEQEIKQAARMRLRSLTLGGGVEPTGSPYLLDAIRLGTKLDLTTVVRTDGGSLSRKRRIQLLEQAGLDELHLVIHGATAPTHGAVVGEGGPTLRHVLTVVARTIPMSALTICLRYPVTPSSLDELPAAVRLAAAIGVAAFVVEHPDGGGLGDLEALEAVERAVRAARESGVRLVACGFERCLVPPSEEMPTRNVGPTMIGTLSLGLPVPLARAGVWSTSERGGTARLRQAIEEDQLGELGLSLAAWGAPMLDAPPCLGGTARLRSEELRFKGRACLACPADTTCPGLPRALEDLSEGQLRPLPAWKAAGPQVAILPARDGDPILREETLPGLGRELEAAGATVSWPSELTSVRDADLVIVCGLDTAARVVPQAPENRWVVLDFHMLQGIDEFIQRWAGPARQPPYRDWWPSDNLEIQSCFPRYIHLYRSFGVPTRQIRWRPYSLHLPSLPEAIPAEKSGWIFSGGNHMRDWETLERAAELIGPRGCPIRVHAPQGVAVRRVGPLDPRGRVDLGTFWEAIAGSRFVVVPLHPHPHRAGGITVIAMAHALGRPAIATYSGATADHIRDGADGLLVRAGDPSALADAIQRLDSDPDLLMQLAAGALQARDRLSTNSWAQELLQGSAVDGIHRHPGGWSVW